MGDKYILELEDKPLCVFDEDTQTYFPRLRRVKGFNSLVFDQNGLNNLTPYTEPDTEKVREEAFKNGYDAACKDIDIKSKINAAYRKGLEDAWEAARKICTNWVLSDSVLSEIFGMDKTIDDIMKETTASEAIEKIRAYEKEKEEQIQVGDEVKLKCGVGSAIYMQGSNGSDEIYLLFNDGSCGFHKRSEIECKTGRHFPDIAEVLRKMKEDTDG